MAMVSFETFYKRYYVPLVRFLISQASDSSWAEEVADDAMMLVWDRWDYLVTYDRPDSWLFKVATRKLRRLESRARDLCYLDEGAEDAGPDLLAAAACDDWIETHLDLIAGLRSLPRRQCDVIALHDLIGFTVAEAASLLGISENTAKTHRARGLENLRQRDGGLVPRIERRIPAWS